MTTPQTVVVADTNILINLMHVSRLDVCGRLPAHRFVIPNEVVEEVELPHHQAALQVALTSGVLQVTPVTGVDSLVLFAELRERFGKGESACLALAKANGWVMATDERKKGQRRFLAAARTHLGTGRIIQTETIYVMAIKAGVLSVADADADKIALETRYRFKMPFASFQDVLATHTGAD